MGFAPSLRLSVSLSLGLSALRVAGRLHARMRNLCARAGQCAQAGPRSRAPRSPLPPRMPTVGGSSESSLADALEHVEDARVLRLLPQHVLVKVVLHWELLPEELQQPRMDDSGPFFLHGPASWTHLNVLEQQRRPARPASCFLSTLRISICRGVCAAGGARRARRGAAATRDARAMQAGSRLADGGRAAHRPCERRRSGTLTLHTGFSR